MTRADRAKQFLPFAALSGLEKALAKQEFVPEERRLLGEDAQAELDTTLRSLGIGNTVTVTYYHAAAYQTLTGPVDRVDPMRRVLAVNGVIIPFVDLYSVDRIM